MTFGNTIFSAPTTMIEPQTKGGKDLYQKYQSKIGDVKNSKGSFPKSGPGSRGEQIDSLKQEYNQMLATIEDVNKEDALPTMKEPTSPAAKAYHEKMMARHNEIKNSKGSFPRSGPESQQAKMIAVITEYNQNVSKYEA